MGDLETAAVRLALFTLAFLAVVGGLWWYRRPKPEHAAPRLPRESRLPRLSRRAPEIEEVEIAPERLARISRRAPFDRPDDPAFDERAPEDEANETVPPIDADESADAPAPTEAVPAADPWTETPIAQESEFESAPVAPFAQPVEDEPVELRLDAMAARVAGLAHDGEEQEAVSAPAVTVRLAPQIPPRDAISTHSRLGGRPRLPVTMEWPRVDGRDGDVLAQVACAELPPELWDGVGPRTGSLIFLANPDSGAPAVVHIDEDGPPREPPHDPGVLWAGLGGDIAPMAIRAFPEWPVDVVAVHPGDEAPTVGDAPDLYAQGYDIADPAFHPFDWDSMLALAAILESRLERLPIDGVAPTDANDELMQAIGEAAESNRDAHARAQEIVAIIRDSAGHAAFSATDATAVMSALHAIRWNEVITATDPETGEDQVETLTLPLTRHHPGAELWVHDYLTVLADHAKHVWCADPDRLSAPARALFETEWQAAAEREAATMGRMPQGYSPDFNPAVDVVLIDLPVSPVMSRGATGDATMTISIRKADLAVGDFSRVKRVRRTD